MAGICIVISFQCFRGAELHSILCHVQDFRQSGRAAQEWPDFCQARVLAGKENNGQSPGLSREKLMSSGSGNAPSPAGLALSTAGSDASGELHFTTDRFALRALGAF